MNIADEYMGAGKNVWIDVAVQIEGQAVQDLEEVFRRDWQFATGIEVDSSFDQSPTLTSNNQIQIIPTGPDLKNDPLYDFILNLIYNAKEHIWLATPYFIPDESLAKALELALRRGVEVKIWVPKRSNHRLADFAGRSYLHDLFSVGAEILYVSKMMHGKALVVDTNYALSGSANFDMRSLFINYEIGIVTFGKEVILSFKNWFETLPAERLTIWPKHNFYERLVEEVARVLGPVI
jgi:cardiolipin synthase